jgi:integrase
VEILNSVRKLGQRGKYLFSSLRTPNVPMSENTINAALRRMGYPKEEQTGHGFRTIASTFLNEMGWNPDWIERQLAHVDEDESRRSYNAAQWLPDRTRMMQAWADHLDALKSKNQSPTSRNAYESSSNR